jgi:hypothetical protein
MIESILVSTCCTLLSFDDGSAYQTMQDFYTDVIAVVDGLWAPPQRETPQQDEMPQEKTEQQENDEESDQSNNNDEE